MKFEPTRYKLQSVKYGNIFEDTGWMLSSPFENDEGLIRTVYEKKQIEVKGLEYGLYRFSDWLPVHQMLDGSAAPVTYRSEKLCKITGLPNLYITFSGYWPEKGAFMQTCSFKETEAYSVCARLEKNTDKVLVVASAGNTARAFAKVCSDNGIKLLLCVPEDNIEDAMWFNHPIQSCVKLISSRRGSDYFDSILLSGIAQEHPQFLPEGGAKNVARRDGMATTVLSASYEIGRIPDYYFQAIGSGTGAIAAYEANLRLIEDGRFGKHMMKHILSQNKPFIPIVEAWQKGTREFPELDENLTRKQVAEIIAKVLSNRKPPYSIPGGVYDTLYNTGGEMMGITNSEAHEAAAIFEENEGIDIHPAAAVAFASLLKKARNGSIDKNAIVMLNVTGGGEKLFASENKLYRLKPDYVFDYNPDKNEVWKVIEKLFQFN